MPNTEITFEKFDKQVDEETSDFSSLNTNRDGESN